MNTTTITINWEDYEGFRQAIAAIGNSTRNTFTEKSDQYEIEAYSHRIRWSAEKQREVMEFFECFTNVRVETQLCYKRFLIWRYCWTKFEITTTQIARITGHNRSSVTCGLNKIDQLLEQDEIKAMRAEVFAKCDQVFV